MGGNSVYSSNTNIVYSSNKISYIIPISLIVYMFYNSIIDHATYDTSLHLKRQTTFGHKYEIINKYELFSYFYSKGS